MSLSQRCPAAAAPGKTLGKSKKSRPAFLVEEELPFLTILWDQSEKSEGSPPPIAAAASLGWMMEWDGGGKSRPHVLGPPLYPQEGCLSPHRDTQSLAAPDGSRFCCDPDRPSQGKEK